MHKVIIFDFFGVYCAPIATNWLKKAVPGYESKLGDFQVLCTQSDLGKLTRTEFNQKASELTGMPADQVKAGIEAEVAINADLVAYTQQLKTEGYRIACLSNGGHEWTLQVINDHGLRDLFEEVVLSADVGIVKPDLEIYSYTLNKLKIPASEAIFVDDRPVNVDAAKICGMTGLLFTDVTTFANDIESLTGSMARS